MSLYDRYKNGEQREVWAYIRTQSNQSCWENVDIVSVARATMERVAKNADFIAGRLKSEGWFALTGDTIDLRTLPAPEDGAIFSMVREVTQAPLPLSLEVFWTIVGGINWVWDYERRTPRPTLGVDAPLDELDPLCVYPPEAAAYAVDEWMDDSYQEYSGLPPGQFRLDLAPDDLHKANISGGDPYGMILPSNSPDPLFSAGSQSLPFVDYLRHCFSWAGFPGLESHAHQSDVDKFIATFSDGLVPF